MLFEVKSLRKITCLLAEQPFEIEFHEQYDRDGTIKVVKLQSNLTCEFRERFIAAVVNNLRARFDITLLLNCKFLDGRF